jgi:catechol 2,3-dioxygenase-like lactoylglutathione lyase family enzyme
MASIRGIGMIIIMQPHIEEAVTFYKNLGLKLQFHLKEKWAEFDAHNIRIGLCPTSREATERVRTGIVMEVSDLYATYNDLKNRVTFLGEPTEAVHGIMVSFQDPGGNIIDFYQPTPEKVKELVRKTVEEDNQGCCKTEQNDDGCCKK